MKNKISYNSISKAVGTFFVLLLLCVFGTFAQGFQDRQLADQYLNNAEYEKAAQLYEKLMDRDPFGTYPQYFKCLISLKDFDEAEKLAKKMVKKQDTNLSFFVDLGYVYSLENSPEKSKLQYDKAIKLLKADQNQILVLANAFTNRQETDYALETYLEGKKLMGQIYGFYFETAEAYYQKGNYEKMIEEYLDAVNENAMVEQNVLNILQARIGTDPENKRTDLLRIALLRRIQRTPEKTEFSEMLIWLFIQQKDFDSALIQAKALDKRMKEDGGRIVSIAALASANANYDIAIKAYQYVIDKGVDNNNYIPSRMEMLNTMNKKITVDNNYTKQDLLKLEKDYLATLNELGRSGRTATLIKGLAHLRAFYLDNIDSAATDLEEAVDFPNISAQSKADCKLELGDIYLFSGNVWDSDLLYAQVDKDFKHDALGQEAKFRGARLDYFRGDFLWAQAQLDVLKSATSQLIANDALALSLLISDNMGLDSTTDALLLYSRADLLSYRNKNDEALAVLDSIHILFPTHSLSDDAWYKEAQIMDVKRNWNAEDSLYEKILRYDSASVLADDALYQRALLRETKMNDKAKASELYQQLIVNYPGSVFVVEARKRYRALRGDLIN